MMSASSKPGVWCWACGLPSVATAHQASTLPTTSAPPRRSERLWRRPTAPEALSCALRRWQSGEAPPEPSPTLMAMYGKLPTIQVGLSARTVRFTYGRVPRLWCRYLMVRALHLPQALVYQTWLLATYQGLSARGLGSPLTSGIERAHSVHPQPPDHPPNAWAAAASGRPPDAPRNRTLIPLVTPRSHHDGQPGLCQMVSGKDTICP